MSNPKASGIVIDDLIKVKISPIGTPDLSEWRKIVERKNPFKNMDGSPPTDEQLLQLLVASYTSAAERIRHAVFGALAGAEFNVFAALRSVKTQWEIDAVLTHNAEYLKVFIPNLVTNYYNSMIKTLPISLSLSVSVPKLGYVDNQWTHPVTGMEVIGEGLADQLEQVRRELAMKEEARVGNI